MSELLERLNYWSGYGIHAVLLMSYISLKYLHQVLRLCNWCSLSVIYFVCEQEYCKKIY